MRSVLKAKGTEVPLTGRDGITISNPNLGAGGNPAKCHKDKGVLSRFGDPETLLGPRKPAVASEREITSGRLEGLKGTINGSSRTVDLGCRSVTRVARIAEGRRPFMAEIGSGSRGKVTKAWYSEGDFTTRELAQLRSRRRGNGEAAR